MELAPDKRELLAQHSREQAALQAELNRLDHDYHRQLEKFRRQVRKKVFTRQISRTHRYHEEKSFWEYVNNFVEDIHLFTWKKAAVTSCTQKYRRKRLILEEELRDLNAQQRHERITLRYTIPPPKEENDTDLKGATPNFF